MSTKTTTISVAIVQSRATKLAELIGASNASMYAIELVIDANTEIKMGPLKLREFLMTDLGDAMDAAPEPDSETGNNPDRYAIPGKKAKGSFYSDLYGDLPLGKKQSAVLDGVAKAVAGSADTPAEYAKMGSPELTRLKNKTRQQYSAGARCLKTAFTLHFQLAKLENFATVDVDVRPAKEEATYPVTIGNVAKRADFKNLSVGGVCALDLDAAKEKGGSYEDIISTLKRTANPDDNATSIKDTDQLYVTFTDIVNYLEPVFSDPKRLAALFKSLSAPTSDATLYTIAVLEGLLDRIASKPDFAKRASAVRAAMLRNASGAADTTEQADAA